ncbi:hypothetical protein GQX74_003391 [Glossina fuscipes]|nr:hypothetical protein GQX74_003391 [Glossina fuscipes]
MLEEDEMMEELEPELDSLEITDITDQIRREKIRLLRVLEHVLEDVLESVEEFDEDNIPFKKMRILILISEKDILLKIGNDFYMHGKLAWQIFFEIRKRCANFQRRFLASHDDSRVTKGLVIGVYQKEGGKDPKLTPSGEKFDDRQ